MFLRLIKAALIAAVVLVYRATGWIVRGALGPDRRGPRCPGRGGLLRGPERLERPHRHRPPQGRGPRPGGPPPPARLPDLLSGRELQGGRIPVHDAARCQGRPLPDLRRPHLSRAGHRPGRADGAEIGRTPQAGRRGGRGRVPSRLSRRRAHRRYGPAGQGPRGLSLPEHVQHAPEGRGGRPRRGHGRGIPRASSTTGIDGGPPSSG